MEELLESLDSCFSVSQDNFCTYKTHPRFSQYKQKTSKASQEERRKLTLLSQKQKRYDYQNHVRRLAQADFLVEDEAADEECKEIPEEMDWIPPKIQQPRAYKNQIMLSEWLVDVPSDFSLNWYMVPAPVGKRCLIVASKGRTKVYSRSGYKITEFNSLLPGSSSYGDGCTILDCLWNEYKQTYYVLDVQCWNQIPLLGCETECRFYWLQSKFQEELDLGRKSLKNRYPFVRLPFISCTKEEIGNFMRDQGGTWDPLDGLLFYHKMALYTPGVSPLVGWLKAFMLPEILGIPVAEEYVQKRPQGYVNVEQHIYKKSKGKRKENTELMDIQQKE